MSEMVTLAGLDEAKENLAELDRKVQKSIVRKGVRKGCKVLLDASRAAAPELSGKLRKNIKIRGKSSKPGTFALSVGVSAKDFTGPAFYGVFVLLGHRVGARRLGDKRKIVPANDFLQRAFDATHEQAAEVAGDTIGELIQQEGTKQ